MAKIVEVPNVGNVEFPDEMSDDQIADAIKQQMPQAMPQEQQDTVSPAVPGAMATSATSGISPTATGITDVAKGVAGAVKEAGVGPAAAAVKNYFAHPITNIGVDLASHAMGSPVPPMATKAAFPYAQAVYQKYQSALHNLSDLSPEAEKVISGASDYLQNRVTPGEMREITDQLHSGNDLSKFTVPARLAGDAEAQSLQQAIRSAAPSLGSKIAGSLAPLATSAGRAVKALGTAGMVYDVGKGLFYTSPEEIATLKEAEAKRRAEGWLPLNEQLKQQQAQQDATNQPPSSNNFMARVTNLTHKYLPTKQTFFGQ